MTSDTTDSLLKGLGCSMMAKSPMGKFPEECLADISNILLQDLKALVLCVGALTANSQFFHPEFLLKTIKNQECDFNVIGALLLKIQDRRFAKVISFCREQKYESLKPAKILSFASKIGQASLDAEFKKFGIEVSQVNVVSSKKIVKIDLLVRTNVFVRNRLLFGCNWRADIISMIETGLDTPTAIKNRLHCSYETSHRVFNEYNLAMGL